MPAHFYCGDPSAPTPNLPRSLGSTLVALNADWSKVLLEHRTDSDLWGLFGGSADPGETALQALRRELREETGLEPSFIQFLGVWTDPSRICAYPDGNVFSPITIAFLGQLPDTELTLSEESRDANWFAWDEIPWTQVPATQIPILRAALRRRDEPTFVHVD